MEAAEYPCDRAGVVPHDMTDPAIRGGMGEVLKHVARPARPARPGLRPRPRRFLVVRGSSLDPDRDLVGGTPSERLTWLYNHHPTWGIIARGSSSSTGSAAGKKNSWWGHKLEIFGSKGFVALTGRSLDTSITELGDGAELLLG